MALSDFGFVKSIFNRRVYDPVQFLHPEWLAPEFLVGTLTHDERMLDVYAFGLVFYAIITRQPLFEIPNAMILGYKIATEKLTPEIPAFIPTPLVDFINKAALMTKCWSTAPNSRPPLRLTYNQLLQYKL